MDVEGKLVGTVGLVSGADETQVDDGPGGCEANAIAIESDTACEVMRVDPHVVVLSIVTGVAGGLREAPAITASRTSMVSLAQDFSSLQCSIQTNR